MNYFIRPRKAIRSFTSIYFIDEISVTQILRAEKCLYRLFSRINYRFKALQHAHQMRARARIECDTRKYCDLYK